MAQAKRSFKQSEQPEQPQVVRLPTGMRFPKDIWDDLPQGTRHAFLRMGRDEVEEQWRGA